jgi:hypothetical protein
MIRIAHARSIHTIEIMLAALIGTALLSANLLAYLLYLNPSSELLWRISLPVNRAAAPLTLAIENITDHGILLSILLLVPILAFAAWSHKSRSWLGTAICGHVGLAGVAFCIANLADSRLKQTVLAGNLWYVDPELLDARLLSFATIFAALAAMCVLNHVMFFRRRS